MSLSSFVGSLGVALLLVAFFLNLFHYLHQDNKWYIFLNILGGAISAYASILIHFIPFLILELTWVLVSLIAFVKEIKKSTSLKPSSSPDK